jgi:hypothetical protein
VIDVAWKRLAEAGMEDLVVDSNGGETALALGERGFLS